MIYKFIAYQNCVGYWKITGTVEANSKEEAEIKVKNEDYEISECSSEELTENGEISVEYLDIQ